ncbi:hypothetical protein V1512DRAFT_258146 [Lipomyces arxii]|uniref:uncharacterized protein n=1 Tax=Lipomyces arxii TaxID=56418 RepID=UPI0034CD2656
MDSYRIINTAKAKLANAVRQSDTDLRILVSHANLLDSLMAYNEDVTRDRRTVTYDVRELDEYDSDSGSDSESDSSDSDSDSGEDPVEYDDQEDEEEYALTRTSSHHSDVDADALLDLRSQLLSVAQEKAQLPSRLDFNDDEDDEYDNNDDDDDDDDDTSFYELANRHKYEQHQHDDLPQLAYTTSESESDEEDSPTNTVSPVRHVTFDLKSIIRHPVALMI